MCGKNNLRFISAFIMVVLIFIALCGFALASAPNKQPVQGTSPISKPEGSTPTTDVKAGIPPSITSIVPDKGRQGNSVALVGANFGSTQGSSYVSFGPFKATGYGSWSDTLIWCGVPPIAGVTFPVTGPVVVVTSDGTSNAVAFTVFAPNPTVTSISPSVWVTNSSTALTITGTGFNEGTTVVLAAGIIAVPDNLPVSNIVVKSSTKITCNVKIPKWSELTRGATWEFPAIPPVHFSAIVTNPDGGHSSGGSFYVMPNVCGAGALTPIIGFGLAMGVMTLAGTVRARRRRTKNS